MSLFPSEILDEASAILDLCRTQSLTLTAAESCTGGLISACFTEVAGASDVFERGFVTYSNRSKQEMLGVSQHTLERFGAVSKETALEMAHGAMSRAAAGIAIAVTGIAGPGGGTQDKPVGLVHLAVCSSAMPSAHRECRFGDTGRAEIRTETLLAALDLVRKVLLARSQRE
jgi:nicotinamide-nucleotide amidase